MRLTAPTQPKAVLLMKQTCPSQLPFLPSHLELKSLPCPVPTSNLTVLFHNESPAACVLGCLQTGISPEAQTAVKHVNTCTIFSCQVVCKRSVSTQNQTTFVCKNSPPLYAELLTKMVLHQTSKLWKELRPPPAASHQLLSKIATPMQLRVLLSKYIPAPIVILTPPWSLVTVFPLKVMPFLFAFSA